MKKLILDSKLYLIALFTIMLFVLPGCGEDEPDFSALGLWTVQYEYNEGIFFSGSFTATYKSNGMWDFVEGPTSVADVGSWSATDNSITFNFDTSGDAVYTGSVDGDNALSGTMIADAGTSSGFWSATR